MRRILDFSGDFTCFCISLLASLYVDNIIYAGAFLFCALTSLWHVVQPRTANSNLRDDAA